MTSKDSELSAIFLFFFFSFVLIEHVTFLFPGATFSQMVENKRDLPKKLVEPFGSSCQFESEGTRPSFLSERKSIQREGRNAGLGGAFVVVVRRRGHYSRKGKSSNEGRKSYVPTPLSGSAVVLSAALAAAGHLMGAEL